MDDWCKAQDEKTEFLKYLRLDPDDAAELPHCGRATTPSRRLSPHRHVVMFV